jgi:hypothetical protein
MHYQRLSIVRQLVLIGMLLTMLFQPQGTVYAAANLTVTPITWNIIGLDSNKVTDGPNHFPIGVRVCNTGDATAMGVTADFVWDSTNAYIYNRPGTATTLALGDLAQLTAVQLLVVRLRRVSYMWNIWFHNLAMLLPISNWTVFRSHRVERCRL